MRRSLSLWACATGGLMLAASPASAQWGERTFSIQEIAADLAYGFCPLYLSSQFPLTDNPMLAERGFGKEVTRSPDVRFGEVEQVKAVKPDGTAAFGGVSGQVCNVTITGADGDAVLARLKSNMPFLGIPMQPDATHSGEQVEAFKGAIQEGQVLHIQLARTGDAGKTIVAQLYVTPE